MANAVPDSRSPRRLTAVSSDHRAHRDQHLVGGHERHHRAEVGHPGGDRHRDREHVVDQQRAGHPDAELRPQVDGGHLVVAAAGGVGVHVLPVAGHHGEHHHDDGQGDPRREEVRATAPAMERVSRISSGAYATLDSASEANTGSAMRFGRRVCWSRSDRNGRPRRAASAARWDWPRTPRVRPPGGGAGVGDHRCSRRRGTVGPRSRPGRGRLALEGHRQRERDAPWEGQRARRDHGMWSGRVDPRPQPGVPRALGGGDRPGRRRLPPARPRLRRDHGDRGRLRRRGAAAGRHRARGRLRGGVQRRQLQHHLGPAGPRDVRRVPGRRPHLRPAPGAGLRAAGHPHRGHRAVDRRPDAAAPGAGGQRGDLPRPDEHGVDHRGARAQGLDRSAGAGAGGGDRGPGGLPDPLRHRHAAHRLHRRAGGRPGLHAGHR